jgi:hypothetical protein
VPSYLPGKTRFYHRDTVGSVNIRFVGLYAGRNGKWPGTIMKPRDKNAVTS